MEMRRTATSFENRKKNKCTSLDVSRICSFSISDLTMTFSGSKKRKQIESLIKENKTDQVGTFPILLDFRIRIKKFPY
jgi:hypothetical protein